MELKVLGIRHHGVGSAGQMLDQLKEFNPDRIIVEGPHELDDLVARYDLSRFKPPVAALIYNTKLLKQSTFYPFAVFSPEWQALLFGQKNNISVRMADLPAKNYFGLINQEEKPSSPTAFSMKHLAKAAGYDNHDEWWNRYFEEPFANDSNGHFDAVMMMMQALRNANDDIENGDIENRRREAFMRQAIREAEQNKCERVVFVCGAYHGPALLNYDDKNVIKNDKKLLSKLPKTPITATWIPWSNTRLSWHSGYGAGIKSPGWYHHLWKNPEDNGEKWMVSVAQIFRKNKKDISAAHIIESIRLAQALASMRQKERPSLIEFEDAIKSVMLMGGDVFLNYINEELIIGNEFGKVPKEALDIPIQVDFETKRKRYRLKVGEKRKELKLDLRTERGLEKSIFLHQLVLLEVAWGELVSSDGKGSFKEIWYLNWSPNVILNIIDKGIWGNTIQIAAENYLNHLVENETEIAKISDLLSAAIRCELYDSIPLIVNKIKKLSNSNATVIQLIQTILPLMNVVRFSSVRQTDADVIYDLIINLMEKTSIGLPTACLGLSTTHGLDMFEAISQLHSNVRFLKNTEITKQWFEALEKVAKEKENVPSILLGCTYRLLFEERIFTRDYTIKGLSLALSSSQNPDKSAAWLEGFLRGSVLILILDYQLWNAIFSWINALDEDDFEFIYPLMRRTFSRFKSNERKQIGEKAAFDLGKKQKIVSVADKYDSEREEVALNLVFSMLKK